MRLQINLELQYYSTAPLSTCPSSITRLLDLKYIYQQYLSESLPHTQLEYPGKKIIMIIIIIKGEDSFLKRKRKTETSFSLNSEFPLSTFLSKLPL